MRPLILGRATRNVGRKLHKPSIHRSWRSISRFAAVLFAVSAALCGCQRYADLAGPVELPIREIAGPGECITTLEWPDEYDAADSSTICWDGDRPHMVQYSRPRLPKKTCGESLYMPEGRVRRWFGCPKKPVGDPI